MNNNKSLTQHISDFFEYCDKEKDFSDKTIENYNRYLHRFISWLKTSNLTHLTPLELSAKHINDYQLYLSNQNIKKNTQNYYLIALRVLISYFIEKEIPCSAQIEKIKLQKTEKQKFKNNLTPEQLEKLLLAPNTSHNIGLRDRVILETICSTGLKIAELVSINKDDIKMDDFTKRAAINVRDKRGGARLVYLASTTVEWLTKYLDDRKDHDKALFINYRPQKENNLSPARLTVRSIERMVQKYGEFVGISQTITPETLRNAHIKSILDSPTMIKASDWNVIENQIAKEILWLKENIDTLPEGYRGKNSLIVCEDCILRKLAILIVSKKIKAQKIKFEKLPWKYDVEIYKNHTHGEEWHRKMISAVANHFERENYQTSLEPIINFGRADVGAFSKSSKLSIYIEIGTTSLYKLLYNLLTVQNSTFLIIPAEEYMIEFKT